jgi:type I restriction enzyme, S subunit
MSNWEEKYLIDFATLNYGDNLPSSLLKPSGFRVFGANGYIGFHDNYNINRQTVLISCRGEYSGTINIVPEKTFVTNNSIIVNLKSDDVDTTFIYYKLQTINRAQIVSGSAQPQVTIIDLKRVTLKLPENEEQQHIAKILSTADAVIEKTQAAIAKYKAIKQGMLQDLFTRGIDMTSTSSATTGKLRPRYEDTPELYKDSKLGWIPGEWEVMSLEDSTDYVDYRGKTPPKSDFGVFLITAKNIRFGFIDYEISKEYIREDAFEEAMSRGKVKLGDVLITTEAPLGNVAQINKENVALAQRVIKYRGYEDLLNNDFLALCLMSYGFQKQLFAEASGTTVLGIKGSRLHKLKIVIPEIPEQTEIVKHLRAIDNKLQTEQAYLQKMQSLKKGLMEDLLSGRKRVATAIKETL